MTEKPIQKKEQIIQAAFKCFKQFGYSKTTFGDIAKTAGVSRALIYSYFKNKNDLFITMTKNLHNHFQAMSAEILKSDGTDKEKLFKIIDVWIINSYRNLRNNIYGNDVLDGLVKVSEQTEKRFRTLFIKSIEPIAGKEMAEIIVLSTRGLMEDRPPVKTLQKRIALLINKME